MSIKKQSKSSNILLPEAGKGTLSSHKTKINLWMDAEMYHQLKVAAAEEQITVTSIICKGAKNYLNEKNTREMRE